MKDRYYDLKHASHEELLEATLWLLTSPYEDNKNEMLTICGIQKGSIEMNKRALRAIINGDKNAWEYVAEATLEGYRKFKEAL